MTIDNITICRLLHKRAKFENGSSRTRNALRRVRTIAAYIFLGTLSSAATTLLAIASLYQPWELGL